MNADNDNPADEPHDISPEDDAVDHADIIDPADAGDVAASVFIIIGRVSKRRGGQKSEVHVMLKAPDDDYAVRETLNALSREGYAEAELDQIGVLDGVPAEEPHASAYQGVLDGEVAIIAHD